MKRAAGSVFREESVCAYFGDGRTAVLEYLFADEKAISNYHLFPFERVPPLGGFFTETTAAAPPVFRSVEIADFKPSKSQRRTLRANRDIRVSVTGSEFTYDKFELYKKYVSVKHHRSEYDDKRLYETLLAIHYGYPSIREMNYFYREKIDRGRNRGGRSR